MGRDSGLVHTMVGAAANVAGVTQTAQLLHGQEKQVFADAGYARVDKPEELKDNAREWEIATSTGPGALAAPRQLASASCQPRIQTPYLQNPTEQRAGFTHLVIKCQFGHCKVRYKGLAKNTAQLQVMFALANLWLAKNIVADDGSGASANRVIGRKRAEMVGIWSL